MEGDITGKNVPIAFWGQVVDQDGAPLAGVRVAVTVRHWRFSAPSGISASFPKSEMLSDTDGRFEITGETGDNLTLTTVHKEGYRLSPKTMKTFSYGETAEPFTPDFNNPVVIRMLKEVPAEGLKTFHASKMISCDGMPIAINLLEGKLSEGASAKGNLTVSFERTPRDIPVNNREPFDWRMVVAGADVEIQVVRDEVAYLAPVEGYEKRIEINAPRTSRDWTPIKQVPLFVKGPEGRFFGSVTLEIRANYEGERTGFSIDATMNLKGSRNLQPAN